ncbi:hypothetical protein F2Q68_00007760 [Brassica cretica]|uniref:Uncharacterized protein n=1 Tax=Brassica cretica TaxID=69181 RepID=A0A8S9KPJ5_BRACR|nr:hypothetical protein F2Q68_00007760 [Brassica cretica]
MAVSKAYCCLVPSYENSKFDLETSRTYLSVLGDAVLSLLSFACLFPLPLLVYDVNFYKKVQRNRIVEAAKVLVSMVTPIETTQETFRSRFEGERKDGDETKGVSIGIQKRMQRRIFLRPGRSLHSKLEV